MRKEFSPGNIDEKNLIDLTPKLEVESKEKLKFTSSQIKKNPFSDQKSKSYSLAKNTIIAKPAFAKGVMYSTDAKGFVSAYSLKKKKILFQFAQSRGKPTWSN